VHSESDGKVKIEGNRELAVEVSMVWGLWNELASIQPDKIIAAYPMKITQSLHESLDREVRGAQVCNLVEFQNI
jgi:hypothetical protein